MTTALFAAAMAAAALASPAASQEGDAYSQDPDSPGGSQYRIPSEQVRRDLGGGSGGGRGNEQRGGESPRFGEGIEPRGEDEGEGGSDDAAGGSSGDGGDDSGGAAGAAGSGDAGDSGGSTASASGSGDAAGGGTSGSSDSPGTLDDLATTSSESPVNAPTLAIAFAVLVGGAAVGLFLRRRRSF